MQGIEVANIVVSGNEVGIQTEGKEEDHTHLGCVCPMGANVSSLFSHSLSHHLLMKAQYFAKRVEDEKFLSY